jgi:hemerythrin superfamily protein
MAESQQGGQPIVSLIQEDHAALRRELDALEQATDAERPRRFADLTEHLVRHEVAEELVVYPALRRLPGGDRVADARIAEQAEAEQRLAELDRFRSDTAEFHTTFTQLRGSVLDHAALEESDVIPLLSSALSEEEAGEMGRRYVSARSSAPTHPHPSAPDTPPANTVAGPIVALFDRIRDAARHV